MEDKELKKYPYLGYRAYKEKDYVVLFTKENYGIVVMSDVTELPELKFGYIGEFNEALFTPLPEDRCVRLSN